jgi:hypothetical protein
MPVKCEGLQASHLKFQPHGWVELLMMRFNRVRILIRTHMFIANVDDSSPHEAQLICKQSPCSKHRGVSQLFQNTLTEYPSHWCDVWYWLLHSLDTDTISVLVIYRMQNHGVSVQPARHLGLMADCLSMTLRICSSIHTSCTQCRWPIAFNEMFLSLGVSG